MSAESKLLTSALITKAVNLFGSEAKLGKAAGVSQNAIWSAKRKGSCSAKLAVAIDTATDGAVSKHLLRPDLFEQNSTRAQSVVSPVKVTLHSFGSIDIDADEHRIMLSQHDPEDGPQSILIARDQQTSFIGLLRNLELGNRRNG